MLKEGDKAPLFKGINQFGKEIKLSDFKKQKVVLYFYPKDNTPTCTVQACNLRDNFELLQKQGYTVIGVSPDKIKSHEKFSEKFDLPFSLIADPELEIIQQYGVWGEKQLYGRKYMGLIRTTFIIEKGVIKKIIHKPKSKMHAEEILN